MYRNSQIHNFLNHQQITVIYWIDQSDKIIETLTFTQKNHLNFKIIFRENNAFCFESATFEKYLLLSSLLLYKTNT